jgi:putative transposase
LSQSLSERFGQPFVADFGKFVVLRISRSSVYYLPRPVPEADLAIMRCLDRLHLEFPFAGSRMLRGLLAAEGCKIGRRHVKTLMRRMGIEARYRPLYDHGC